MLAQGLLLHETEHLKQMSIVVSFLYLNLCTVLCIRKLILGLYNVSYHARSLFLSAGPIAGTVWRS